MNISNFPASRALQNASSEWLSKLLGTAYGFHAYAHRNKYMSDDQLEYIGVHRKVGGRILGGFPVWYASRKPVLARPGAAFVRRVSGEDHWFYRSDSEFVAIQFCPLEGPNFPEDATVFCQVNYNGREDPRLSSTFIVSLELLTRVGLFLDEMGAQGAYPRVIVIPDTSQCGLLVTTNHGASRHLREHVVFPLPELSFGRVNRQGDDFRDSKMSLDQFVLSSEYPMKIASGSSRDRG